MMMTMIETSETFVKREMNSTERSLVANRSAMKHAITQLCRTFVFTFIPIAIFAPNDLSADVVVVFGAPNLSVVRFLT